MFRANGIAAFAGFVALTLVSAGCIPSEPPAETEPPGTVPSGLIDEDPATVAAKILRLQDEWVEFALRFDGVQTDAARAMFAAAELAVLGENTLDPIIAVIADPESSPRAKVFAVQCLAGKLTPEYLSTLTPLLEMQDVTARACGTALIGQIDAPQSRELLAKMVGDPERRVFFSALLGLAHFGESEARSRLITMYSEGSTTGQEQEQIVETILEAPEKGGVAELVKALGAENTMIPARTRIAHALGRFGDLSTLDALRARMDRTKDETLLSILDSTIKAIEERTSASTDG